LVCKISISPFFCNWWEYLLLNLAKFEVVTHHLRWIPFYDVVVDKHISVFCKILFSHFVKMRINILINTRCIIIYG
jgi:hypothetical protein